MPLGIMTNKQHWCSHTIDRLYADGTSIYERYARYRGLLPVFLVETRGTRPGSFQSTLSTVALLLPWLISMSIDTYTTSTTGTETILPQSTFCCAIQPETPGTVSR